MSKVKDEVKGEENKNVKSSKSLDDKLSRLATAEEVLNLNKTPLEMAEGEELRLILYKKGTYQKGDRSIRYVTLMDVDKNLFYSASQMITNALFDMDLLTGVSIAYEGVDSSGGYDLQVYKVQLLNA